ncbi:autotransporter outer membrane beta-barrel domain-containing protein [Pragia fontium]|uniref:autotransporter outer membrane beta-barrel domain-containing protein n=1 Tax=Pragia fontium TaxID=82985 RepID=UPI0006494ED2|nr:autotransporter outer membrane beta-barrel domain-containing protein [Pragia fontium]AKJ42041.1 hypothetical protein QQ39_08045 [Pragia fontium]
MKLFSRNLQAFSIGSALISGACIYSYPVQADENVLIINSNIEEWINDADYSSSTANQPAILADGNGTTANLSNVNASTTSNRASAILVSNNAYLKHNGENTLISTSGIRSHGIYATSGGYFNISNLTITTTGSSSDGLKLEGSEENVIQSVIVKTDENNSKGIYLLGNGSGRTSLTITNSVIDTEGLNSIGVHLHSASTDENVDLKIDGKTTIITANEKSHGVYAFGAGILGSIAGTENNRIAINTAGLGSRGIFITSGADFTINNLDLLTTGRASNGIQVGDVDSSVDIDNSSITVKGNTSIGIVAHDGGKLVGSKLSVSSADTHGVKSWNGGDISIKDSMVEARFHGLLSESTAENTVSHLKAENIIINSGLESVRASVTNEALILGQEANITLSGENTIVSRERSTLYATGGTITADMKAGSLTAGSAAGASVFYAQGGVIDASLDGTNIVNQGMLVTSTIDNDGRAGDVFLTAKNLAMSGDILADDQSTVNLSLQNATWTGQATSGTQFLVDASSQWNVSGSSDVVSLTNNGNILFSSPIENSFRALTAYSVKTLTVHGDYQGNDGTLTINTILNDDASPTDMLIVEGNTQGKTNLYVNQIAGSGALTRNGIEVVRVGGLSDGQFILVNRVSSGGYEYLLHQGGAVTGDDGNWYLRSELLNPKKPENPDPENPDPEIDSKLKLISPEAGAYATNVALSNTLFMHSLHDRLGEPQFTERLQGKMSTPTSMWLRVVGAREQGRVADSLRTSTNSALVHLGGDIAQWSTNGQDRLHLGVMGGYADAKTKVRSGLLGYQAEGNVHGYSVGLYGTWYANEQDGSGLYTDSWVTYSWFDNQVKGDKMRDENYDSSGISASLESGYTYKTYQGKNHSAFIQPKAQLAWLGVKADDHRDALGNRIVQDHDGNLMSKLGMRVFMQGTSPANRQQTFQPFVEASWIHNTHSYGIGYQGGQGETFSQQGTRNLGELKLGLQGSLTDNFSIWSQVSEQVGTRGYHRTEGVIGMKYSF